MLGFAPAGIVITLFLFDSHNSLVKPEDLPGEGFFTHFEHIRVDQFSWSARTGHGGIYWVSQDELVLEAEIERDRGLFLLDVSTGKARKLVDRPLGKSFRYCFSESTLYVSVGPSYETLRVLYQPTNFNIVSRQWSLPVGAYVSGLRCDAYKRPASRPNSRVYALSSSDGLLNIGPLGDDTRDSIFLTDNEGNFVRMLSKDPDMIDSIKVNADYYPFFDGYISSFTLRQPCRGVAIWTLQRASWQLGAKSYCLGEWAQGASTVIQATKVGLMAEQHSSGRSKSAKYYLVTESEQLAIDMTGGRGLSTAPDGCQLAYGSGEYRRRKSGEYRQYLKLFRVCDYLESKQNIAEQDGT